jgi:hypothetical protein
MSIALSPDGRIPAAGADDTAVRLYPTETGEMVGDLVGHGRWRASRIGLIRRNGNRLALCRRANAKTSGCCPVTVQADPNARLSA